ncbi:hypothetical protein Syun_026003 [Stephania yunnanensis]|uniref:Uncharacterized protein n=1 Tax=Stephania yunnanensis TaxID=152371 RepID=A0AAP0EY69_9MAGN
MVVAVLIATVTFQHRMCITALGKQSWHLRLIHRQLKLKKFEHQGRLWSDLEKIHRLLTRSKGRQHKENESKLYNKTIRRQHKENKSKLYGKVWIDFEKAQRNYVCFDSSKALRGYVDSLNKISPSFKAGSRDTLAALIKKIPGFQAGVSSDVEKFQRILRPYRTKGRQHKENKSKLYDKVWIDFEKLKNSKTIRRHHKENKSKLYGKVWIDFEKAALIKKVQAFMQGVE